MKREFSAGGIVLNKLNQVLLIKNIALRDPQKSYWGFPKGHIDPGEKSAQAAIREVKEETGIEAKIAKKLGDSRYIYTRDREKIFKVVVMFLMEDIGGVPSAQLEEVQEVGWFNVEEALEKLSFKKDVLFLKQALNKDQDGE